MTRDEYLEFIRHQPYDSMGDFSFLLDEKADSSENTATQAVRDNMNADYRWEAPFAGKITNYLLRLKCLILIKTVISIWIPFARLLLK